jgi:hypothetical protein
MILHYSGGVYVDFDTSCRVPLDRRLRAADELVLGLMCDYVDRYPQWRAQRTIQSGGVFDPTSPWPHNPVLVHKLGDGRDAGPSAGRRRDPPRGGERA